MFPGKSLQNSQTFTQTITKYKAPLKLDVSMLLAINDNYLDFF